MIKRVINHLNYRIWMYSKMLSSISIRLNDRSFLSFQSQHKDKLGNHFYIVVVPWTLHLLERCLRFVPKNVHVFLILNGVTAYEKRYIYSRYSEYPIFELSNTLSVDYSYYGRTFVHGEVVSFLLRNNELNFGLLDHDCFVFDRRIFQRLRLDNDEIMSFAFRDINQKTGLVFPKTHIMILKTQTIKELMAKYRIDARVYSKIPAHLKDILLSIGISTDNIPKSVPKKYGTHFDTLQMICCMAIYEGLTFKDITSAGNNILHLGMTTYDRINPISLMILEKQSDEQIKKEYHARFAALFDKEGYPSNHSAISNDPEVIKLVNCLISY